MNAVGNDTISIDQLQSIIDKNVKRFIDQVLLGIDVAVSEANAAEWSALDAQFLEKCSDEARKMLTEYEIMSAKHTNDMAYAAIVSGMMIGQMLPHASSIILGNRSERTVNK